MVKLKAVNLIPREILRKPLLRQFLSLCKRNRWFRYGAFAAAALALLVIIHACAAGLWQINFAAAKNAAQQAKTRLAQLQTQFLELEKQKAGLFKEQAAKQQELDFLSSTMSGEKKYSKLMALISGFVPEDLWVNHFTFSGAEVQIIGSMLNNQLVSQFMENLDKSGVFKNSAFTYSEKQVIENHTIYNFQITTEPIWDHGELKG
ncbi:MAG: hypothetical protein A3G38_00795 [Omnitrophica WOR_2 bacterium RIFCSPLOWO2_12_FULL_51_8]|nr:MAG: hypothetical protein A3G38_00795 [Omnitrophica WOR_2 bacterium RIFCSPLOWO2_12_FULL_51_8]